MNVLMKCFVVLIMVYCGNGAKILGIFNYPSPSHQILGESLLKALAIQGHEVTMLSPFRTVSPPKNYIEILLPELLEYKNENMTEYLLSMQNQSVFEILKSAFLHMTALEDLFFNHRLVKVMINNKRKFDVAIVTWFGYESVLAFSHHVANSTIVFSTLGSTYNVKQITKVPTPYSYVPGIIPPFPERMSFTQRFGNTICNVAMQSLTYLLSYYEQSVISRYIPDAPSMHELIEHVSLVFINTHYSIESPRPYFPHMIQVGGLHLQKEKGLKHDLKQFMDNSSEGVIFFSLGTNIKSSDLSQDKIHGIVNAFSKLPQKILWKMEKVNVPSLPKNIRISEWFPQKEILAHKNTKLFITHGGLLSTMEALYYGVPMIGIPIFGDQSANVLDGAVKGYIYHLPFADISRNSISSAIDEVMSKSKYKENVQFRSRVFRDQLNKPLDTAVYWVEYVIRHDGAHHLKSGVLKLWWYEYELLDVLAVIILTVSASIYAIYRLFKLLRRSCKRIIIKQKLKTKLA